MIKYVATRVYLYKQSDMKKRFEYSFTTIDEAVHFSELVIKYNIEHNLPSVFCTIEPDIIMAHKPYFGVERDQENLKNPLVINDLLILAGR